MLDIWIGPLNLAGLTGIFSAAVLLPLQLLLCRKVRSLALRLAPLLVSAGSGVILGSLSLSVSGWDQLGLMILALYCAFLALVCAAGWLIAHLLKKFSKR